MRLLELPPRPASHRPSLWLRHVPWRSALSLSMCLASSPGCGPLESDTRAGALGDASVSAEVAPIAPSAVPASQARVRVHLVSADGSVLTQPSKWQGVELCQALRCQSFARAGVAPVVGYTPEDGWLIDVRVPAQPVLSLSLTPTPAAAAGEKLAVALSQPLALQEGRRTEVFLALAADGSATFVTASEVPLHAQAVALYLPQRGAQLKLASGFALGVPAGALASASVLAAAEDSVRGVSALYTLWPEVALDRAASVTLPLEPGRIPSGLRLSDYQVRVASHRLALGTLNAEQTAVTQPVDQLGVLQLVTARPFAERPDGTTFVAAEAPLAKSDKAADSCASALQRRMASYEIALSGSGSLRIADCESIPPYVHIVLVNIDDPGLTGPHPEILLPYTSLRDVNGSYALRTLPEHLEGIGATAGINGFTWSGDKGRSDGDVGTFDGTVYSAGVRVHNSQGAEAILGFTAASASGTHAKLFDKPKATSPALAPYSQTAVGSTTSIIKNGSCSRTASDGGDDRWSAMGIGNGRLALVSSTSSDTTTAFDLCPVFTALRATDGAIRLDGGPSAALYYAGRVLNPLSGVAAVLYGSLRHILYPIAAR